MIALRHRAAPAFLAFLVVMALAGCGRSTAPTPSSSTNTPRPADPSLTPVPGGLPTPIVGSSAGPPVTEGSDIGPIFDRLPSSFPTVAGQVPIETGEGPTSGAFAVGAPVAEASRAIATALTAQGWVVDVGSPLEDGSVVLDASGPGLDCKARVQFTPRSGTVSMSVLYGASCPFD